MPQEVFKNFSENEREVSYDDQESWCKSSKWKVIVFSNVGMQFELWLKLNEWQIRRNEVLDHLGGSSRCLPFFFFIPLFFPRRRSSRIVTPRGGFPRRTTVLWVFTSVVVDYDTTPSLSKCYRTLSPGFSRLGQYRKHLTCTLTRIQPRVL